MPLIEAGFADQDGRPNHEHLLQYGPSIKVIVAQLTEMDGLPQPQSTSALVDTGAEQSCIDTQLAQSLQLPVVDVMTISGAGGPRQHDVYAARVSIPDLGMSQYGAFAGVELATGGQLHRVLLGRTFLQGTVMIYDGLRAQVTIASAHMPD